MKCENLNEMINYYVENKPYMQGLSKILYFRHFTEEQKHIYRTIEKIEEVLNQEQDVAIGSQDYLEMMKSVLNLKRNKEDSVTISKKLVDEEDKLIKDSKHVYRTYEYVLNIIKGETVDKSVILSETVVDEPVPFLQHKKFSLLELLQDKNVLKTLELYPEMIGKIVVYVNKNKLSKLKSEAGNIKAQINKLQGQLCEVDEKIEKAENEIYSVENVKTISLINKSIAEFCKPTQTTEETSNSLKEAQTSTEDKNEFLK